MTYQAKATADTRLVVSTDVHSHLVSRPGFLAEIARRKRSGYLILDAGDFFEGTAEFNLLGGEPERRALSALYDVAAPGNHGFDIYERMASSSDHGPVVVQSNLIGWPGPDHWIVPGAMIVAIIGRQAYSACPAEARRRYGFADPVRTLIDLDARAEARGVRLVVLSHQGFEEDLRLAADLVARGVRPLAIFSGHCHSSYAAAGVLGVPVLKGPEHARGYARLHVATGETFVDQIDAAALADGPAHPCLAQSAADLARQVASVGHRRLALDRDTAASRTALLRRVCECVAARWGTQVLMNRGAIRSGIEADYPRCSLLTFYAAVPFDNRLVRLQLRNTLDDAVRSLSIDYGEEVAVAAGGAADNAVVTTDYLSDRLFESNQVRSALPLEAGLHAVAGEAWLIGRGFS